MQCFRLLLIVLITIFIISFSFVWANPPRPSPEGVPVLDIRPMPERLLRIDRRDPQDVFTTGFRSWSNVIGVEGDHDLVNHINGVSLAAARSGEGNPTAFVSTTEEEAAAHMFGVSMGIAMTSGAIPRQDYIWLYTIQPQAPANIIPVHWAFNDYAWRHTPDPATPRPDTPRAREVDRLDDAYFRQREWSYEGDIPGSSIVRAVRFSFNEDNGLFGADGVELDNPHFISGQLAAVQTGNIVDSFDPIIPTRSPIATGYYVVELNDTVAGASAPMLPDLTGLSFTCFSESDSEDEYVSKKRKKRSITKTDTSKNCLTKQQALVFHSDANKVINTKLAIKIDETREYCLTPETADGFIGLTFYSCSTAEKNWRYDIYDRLSIYWKGLDLCLTPPRKVVDSSKGWDFVALEPCDINNSYQRWLMVKGKIFTKWKQNFELQLDEGFAMISAKSDGKSFEIDPKNLTEGFLSQPSPSFSLQSELGLGWYYSGTLYYSNFDKTEPWSSYYWNRSYYDPVSNRISYIDLSSTTSLSSTPAQKYCLQSQINLTKSDWNWTVWVDCFDGVGRAYDTQRWEFVNRTIANNHFRSQVQLQGVIHKDLLWVETHGGTNAGFYFTSRKGTFKWSTSEFSMFSKAPLILPWTIPYADEPQTKETFPSETPKTTSPSGIPLPPGTSDTSDTAEETSPPETAEETPPSFGSIRIGL